MLYLFYANGDFILICNPKKTDDMRLVSSYSCVGRELRELKEIQYYLLQYKETAPYRQKYNFFLSLLKVLTAFIMIPFSLLQE